LLSLALVNPLVFILCPVCWVHPGCLLCAGAWVRVLWCLVRPLVANMCDRDRGMCINVMLAISIPFAEIVTVKRGSAWHKLCK